MEDQERVERRQRRSFSPEYKAEVVELIRSSGRSIAAVCRDMGLAETAVRKWVARADADSGRSNGMTSAERREIAELRRELRVVREERDILKRATAFFARETR
jgi:transposase